MSKGLLPEDKLLDFLLSRHTFEVQHGGTTTLMHHLVGTWRLLKGWGLADPICSAGLFHSAYGTESFLRPVLLACEREALRSLIGLEAEQLVFDFGIAERASFYRTALRDEEVFRITDRRSGEQFVVSPERYRALVHILVANWLEQRPRSSLETTKFMDNRMVMLKLFCEAPASLAVQSASVYSTAQA